MDTSNENKLSILKRALDRHAKALSENWEFAKGMSKQKSECKGDHKSELEIVLDAYAAFSFACGLITLEVLEKDKLIVVSPSMKCEAAVRLSSTPVAFLGMKSAADEIFSIASKNGVEVQV